MRFIGIELWERIKKKEFILVKKGKPERIFRRTGCKNQRWK